MELSYDEVRRIHREEKISSRLVKVDSDFYNALNDFIQGEKRAYMESLSDFSVSKTRNFTNLKKMVEEIFLMREKKILSRALIASRTGDTSADGMASQEAEVFKKTVDLLKRHDSIVEEMFSNGNGHSASAKPKAEKSLSEVKLRILDEIPSFVGGDMKEYGPFSKNQSISLPYKIAKLLISRKMAAEN
jgi:DNA replication factor GINS